MADRPTPASIREWADDLRNERENGAAVSLDKIADKFERLQGRVLALEAALAPFARLAGVAENFPRNWKRKAYLPDFQAAAAILEGARKDD
jgi:hypothetical protein